MNKMQYSPLQGALNTFLVVADYLILVPLGDLNDAIALFHLLIGNLTLKARHRLPLNANRD